MSRVGGRVIFRAISSIFRESLRECVISKLEISLEDSRRAEILCHQIIGNFDQSRILGELLHDTSDDIIWQDSKCLNVSESRR